MFYRTRLHCKGNRTAGWDGRVDDKRTDRVICEMLGFAGSAPTYSPTYRVEPSTYLLLAPGFIFLAFAYRRQKLAQKS